ncbi:MspA family porin [Prescottella defluvii]|uniref:MspA family porin n=1 Tax=Prescottella defluvii TaxID=1323361 RepID=UPI0004F32717|nr:MspA family porin [Prescottella defluvii]
MTEIRKGRFSAVRNVVVAGAVAVGLVVGSAGVAAAAVDDSNSIVDGKGATITVSQQDTFINGVVPLDGSPLTREWFHNGRAAAKIEGPGADKYKGSEIIVGYQVAYPVSLGGKLKMNFVPKLEASGTGVSVAFGPSLDLELAPGGGVKTVEVAKGKFDGAATEIQFANVHGSATGVVGRVTIRPYVTVKSAAGDVVTTFGKPWVL